MMAVKREIRLIALDMDGTLLNHNQEITEENKKAIKRAKESDIQIVISTGRPFQQIERYMDELNLSSFSVTINGSEIWEGRGKLIEQQLFRQEQIERLWKLANIHNLTYWAITEGEIFHNNIPHHMDLSKYKWLKFGFDIHQKSARIPQLQSCVGRQPNDKLGRNCRQI
ncbi:HAD family hydrolase, partial [Caldifermentibacillus hisashii]|uniref:HAD family hydrolase n=1 Tax=Caldifermentibacillus hisashii TaxID=996558 RepID=UPI002E23C7F3|nr:HAD family hydrolase [Caldifermentibacillus hisashii]